MAMHTGKMMAATSIGGQLGWNCEYQYMNQRFWMFFTGYCPPSVQVN
jgi:hypothetical protein